LHPLRLGRAKIPKKGAVIVAANHRSFLDPFVIGLLSRRKMYFVAKAELFENRMLGWLLGALGVFPVRRGSADRKMILTALEILRRGDCLMMFPEGTRTTGPRLGRPLRGIGKLAQKSGAAVVPVTIAGTGSSERNELGVRRIVVSAGEPERCTLDGRTNARPDQALLDRVWAEVERQWSVACEIAATPAAKRPVAP
jgi:1-acyl-sn-glycerol-3-phosphate acyltransferase